MNPLDRDKLSPEQREHQHAAYKAVFEYFARRIPDRATAQDITQETFKRYAAWKLKNPEEEPANLSGFMMNQAKNMFYTYYSKLMNGRSDLPVSDELLNAAVNALAIRERDLFVSGYQVGTEIDVDRRIDLSRAFDALNEKEKAAMVAHTVDGRPYREIGVVLKVTTSRAHQLVQEACAKLNKSSHLVGYGAQRKGGQK
jgi:RNA polymerase sigma factor (sigma-70 family)